MEASPTSRSSSASPAARLLRARQILDEIGRPAAGIAERHRGDLHDQAVAGSPEPAALPEAARDSMPASPPRVAASGTRLALAALAGSRRSDLEGAPAPATRWTRWRAWLAAPPAPGQPTRLELGALGAALIGAAAIGTTIPEQPVRAQTAATAALAPPLAAVPASSAGASTSDAAASADAPAPAQATDGGASAAATTSSGSAAPAAAQTPAAEQTPQNETTTDPSDAGSGTDPLAGGGGALSRVALIVVQGDAPVQWPTAAAGRPARSRAALGTTYTGVAVLPRAPLATTLALTAGQPANAATRAGCTAPSAVAPGTTGTDGVTVGIGCDYPATTPSIAGAVARDGRRWRAYAPAASSAEAAAALCRPYDQAATASQRAAAQQSPLAHLADLSDSGACEAAAAPLDALATDLGGDDPPAWIYVHLAPCGTDGCDAAEATSRDAMLDEALRALGATSPADGGRSATFVVGDGSVDGLAPAGPGAYPANPSDPDAPGAVIGGALLIGDGVAPDATDPIALDPFALARTQADWLGLTPPGLAAGDGVTALARPE